MNGTPPDVLALDARAEIARINDRLREALRLLKRRGLVVAISGGIDSSVCAALAVGAVGSERVLGLLLPERESGRLTIARARALAAHLGLPMIEEDITGILIAMGCYERRDAAARAVFPDYSADCRCKIAIQGGLEGRYNTFQLIIERPDGSSAASTLPSAQLLEIVAATNFKQRVRKTLEYGHADRLHYAVTGTPNRLEYDQGFFVKNGDGAADVKPIAHLYKTQVYALGRALGLPDDICAASPTTDTYSLPQSQDEFYFGLSYERLDYALWAREHGRPAAELAGWLGVTQEYAERIYREIDVKREAARYLHAPALLAAPDHVPDAGRYIPR